MTRQEMQEVIATYRIRSYYVVEHDDGSVTLQFGDDDPMARIHALEMENMLLRDQLRCAMAIAFGVPYDKTEDLIR